MPAVEDEGESLLAAFQVPIVFHPERAPEEEETYLFPTSISSTSSVLPRASSCDNGSFPIGNRVSGTGTAMATIGEKG